MEEDSKFKKWSKGKGNVQGAIGGIMETVGSVAKISDNISRSSETDIRGTRTGKVDTLGNSMSGMSAGAKLGTAVAPGIGTAIGAGVGFLGGLAPSLLAKGPDEQEQLAKQSLFDLGVSVKGVRNEDMFAQSVATAKNGMDVKGADKPIEVEKGELVLRKKGKAFYVDSSFEAINRKSHEEGGEKYNAKTGDIIIPKNKVAKTKRLLKNRDFRGIESMRLNLPSDEGQTKFAEGVGEIKNKPRVEAEIAGPKDPNVRVHDIQRAKAGEREKTDTVIIHRTAGSSNFNPKAGRLTKDGLGAQITINPDGSIDIVGDLSWKMSHAGPDWNGRSIGIEIVGEHKAGLDGKKGDKGYGEWAALTPQQEDALKKVTGQLAVAYNIPPDRFVDHFAATNIDKEAGGLATTAGYGKTNGEGSVAARMVQEYLQGDEFKTKVKNKESFDTGIDTSMVEATLPGYNFETQQEDSSVDNSALIGNGSLSPGNGVLAPKEKKKDAEWYNKDMTDPDNAEKRYEPEQDLSGATGFKNIDEAIAEEDERGYYSRATPTGYRAHLKNKFIVKGFSGSEAEEKMQLLFGELESVGEDDMQAYTATELGKTDNPIHLIGKKFADKILDSDLLTDMNNYWKSTVNTKTGYKVFDIQYDETPDDDPKSPRSGDVSGFTDSPAGKALAKDALKMKEFMYSSDNEDASWFTRRAAQGLNAWDSLRKKYMYGESYEGMTAEEIYSVVNDFSPKELTNFIKESGVGKEAAGFVYDSVSNPEQFSSVGASGVRKLDMMALAVNVPGFIKGIGKGSVAAFAKYKTWKEASKSVEVKDLSPSKMEKAKFFYQALKDKNVTVTGKLTAKGLKSVKKSKKWGVQYEAMKNAPKSKSASKFKETAKGILDGAQQKMKNMDAPDADGLYNDADSLEEIMKLTDQFKKDGIITDAWDPKYKDIVTFFSSTYKAAMKLPLKARDKIMKTFTTMSPKDANESILRLEKLTGSSIDEIKAMSPKNLKKLMDDQTIKAFDDLKASQGKTKEAWASHKKLAAREKELQKTINDTPVGNEKIAGLQEELLKVKNGIVENEDLIETIAKQKQGHWDRVSEVEEFVSTTPSHWKNAVKGEEEIAKNLDGIKGLEGEVKTILDAQKAFSKRADEIVSSGSKEVDNVKNSILQVAKENKDAAKKAAQKAQGSSMSAKTAAIRRSEYAEEVPGLMKGLKLHDDLMTMYKNGSKGLVQIYNELRKRGEPVISDEEVEFIQGEDEEYEVPEMVDEEEDDGDPDLIVPEKEEEVVIDEDEDDGSVEKDEKGRPVLDAVNEGLSTLGSYAGAAYNIARGLEDSEKANRNYVNPTLEKYQDNSQIQRNVIDEAFNVSMSNARGLSGGLASNFRSNIEKSWADKISRNSQVNAQEAQNKIGVAGRNVQRVNQSSQYNASVDNKADQIDMQSEAATKGFLGQGLSDIANIGQVRQRDENQRIQDEKSRELIYGKSKKEEPTKTPSPLDFGAMGGSDEELDDIFRNRSNNYKQ